jgi:hypothetical protein
MFSVSVRPVYTLSCLATAMLHCCPQAFYSWAAKFTPHFPHVRITTCHSYEIQYAFRWQCTNLACVSSAPPVLPP